MTVKEAKEISLESKAIMKLISTAAFSGVNYIMIDNLSKAVHDGLSNFGYHIHNISTGLNESNIKISW